jgi:hypothetical protein
LQFYT